MSCPYIPNSTRKLKNVMMKELGIKSIDELYSDIPEEVSFKGKLEIPESLTEYEVYKHVRSLLSKNANALDMPIFLGAGCWPHYVPAVIEEIISRAEFLTAYTPYQPEISQGMLQALYEYQSMICELTGMEVANCSLYDWASALGEAARMAMRVTHKKRILAPKIIHPERLETLIAYTEPAEAEIVQISYHRETGLLDLEDLKNKISNDTAAVYIENPSYLGFIEEQVKAISEITHDNGALLIVGVDPISLGVLEAPGNYGADIVIGEGQPLGNPMNYGGPLLGIMACKGDMRLIRQMPGRIIGLTVDAEGRKAFCMALQTREQHIRREKASSNICTNEALCAVAAAVYLALLGPKGLRELCENIMAKTHYAMKKLSRINGVKAPLFSSVHFKEFVANFNNAKLSVEEIHKRILELGVHGGKIIKHEFPELGESVLYCVTEVHSKKDIDKLVSVLEEVLV